MERIYLSKGEKEVLRWLINHNGYKVSMSQASFDIAVYSLQMKNLVFAHFSEEARLAFARLSPAGEGYLEVNPKLHNPINWVKVGALAACVAAVIALFALFIACKRMM